MAKLLRCRDVGPDCDTEVRGEAEDVILEQAGVHGQTDYGSEITLELVEVAWAAIKDE